jgi:hypothetical protein
MRIPAAFVLALLAAGSAKPKVEFKPLQRIANLPAGRCQTSVVFKLTVNDGGSEDYYCPKVVFEWEDGTQSSEESDCVPFAQAAKEDHAKTWTKSHSFSSLGTYTVRAHLCQASRKIRVIETTATILGAETCPGYRSSGGIEDPLEDQGAVVHPAHESVKDPCAEREGGAN